MNRPDNTLQRRLRVSDGAFGLMLTAPALIVLSLTILYPVLKGIYVSFCDYGLMNLNDPTWNSFKNYTRLFKSGEIWLFFKNTLVYVFFTVFVQFVLGLGIALLLNSKIRGRNVFRGLFLIPWTLPSVVVAIIWRWMLQQQFGVINYLMYQAGMTSTINISWTTDANLAMVAICVAATWRQLPYMMVMLLAALQGVDQTLVEAARVDGATYPRVLRSVILPAIMPVIISSVWIAVMQNFQMYTIIENITGGGPVSATTTLSLAAYKAAFQSYDFGKGSAIGVLWLALLTVVTIFSNRASNKYASDFQ